MVAALNGYVRSTQRAASENNSATVRSREAHPARTASNETRDRRTGMAFGLFQMSGGGGGVGGDDCGALRGAGGDRGGQKVGDPHKSPANLAVGCLGVKRHPSGS